MSVSSILRRMKYDFKYIFLNHFVNHIPLWHLRKINYILLGMKIGKGSRIGINTIIVEPQNICLGERVIINETCYLDGRGGLSIGNDSSISFGTSIITASHDQNNGFQYFTQKTEIKDHVWIGAKAIVLNGSTLLSYSVIGAGCVFKGIAEECCIYIGNPSKLLKRRTDIEQYRINYKPFFR